MAAQRRREAGRADPIVSILHSVCWHTLLVVGCYGAAVAVAQLILFLREGHYSGTACAFYQGISGNSGCYAYAANPAYGRGVVDYALTEVDMLAAAGLAMCALAGAGIILDAISCRSDLRTSDAHS
ncbi:hypothetical protein [Methylobacterium oxalidis]|uniref:Uncharacterized protein n=1 Tax=Methylobacterium oxalidis TaxID=944322 RepID=A0A512J5P2_9HYPH|nr:hypothetical protein [Methylobacterium oxalidis]GEP05294.1 hypothetical protein MOX02_33320 [Methylobacterium oxalidis]GJE29995.1 hypothetical protein LDDCCGHA_0158 [Methylobacterium oxalidis]GLS64662.1 hypothetical protein GCM10007888_30430 [Methylobacterium oxalidis]